MARPRALSLRRPIAELLVAPHRGIPDAPQPTGLLEFAAASRGSACPDFERDTLVHRRHRQLDAQRGDRQRAAFTGRIQRPQSFGVANEQVGVRAVLFYEPVGLGRFEAAEGLDLWPAINRRRAVGQHLDHPMRVTLHQFGIGRSVARFATDEHVGVERGVDRCDVQLHVGDEHAA